MVPSAPPLPDRLSNSYSKNSQVIPCRIYKKGDPEYGRPPKGSRTEQRDDSSTSTYEITFKQLFDFYTNISNKLVGILLRARKHGYIYFPDEYEILFQGKHDHVKITLLRMPSN
ncbi:unnamed protein product [Rotaria sp. Silwood1]|nr:unnamed protein product [Rotaria sp. Silwood1]